MIANFKFKIRFNLKNVATNNGDNKKIARAIFDIKQVDPAPPHINAEGNQRPKANA